MEVACAIDVPFSPCTRLSFQILLLPSSLSLRQIEIMVIADEFIPFTNERRE